MVEKPEKGAWNHASVDRWIAHGARFQVPLHGIPVQFV